MSKRLEFPKGFYWGAAAASFQVEGGIYNTDWSEGGRQGKVPLADSGPDHYNRYEEDFDLAKSLGHNAHRMSIEWARIEPREGEFDEKEIEHYRKVIQALRVRNLEPFITLWHFTLPSWLSEKGGLENKKFPEYFARYCAYVTKNLHEEYVHWATMNEPNVMTSIGWIRGDWAPWKRKQFLKIPFLLKNLAEAHIKAYKEIKQNHLLSEVGIVKQNMFFHSDKWPWNIFLKFFFKWFWNRYFLNKIKNHVDSIGLNYYKHWHFGHKRTKREVNDMGWEIYPEGIYYTLKELQRYEKPVFVAEAGIADRDDKYRGQYIKDLVYWIHKAIEDGVPVKGYMYWSLLDNFEWALGYKERFGLIEIDYETKERKVRGSAYEYKKICEENALIIED